MAGVGIMNHFCKTKTRRQGDSESAEEVDEFITWTTGEYRQNQAILEFTCLICGSQLKVLVSCTD